MATSTSTLLTVCNRILLNCNERTISDTSSTLIGQQVRECVRSALISLCKFGEWTWTNDRVTASSWSAQVATLGTDVHRIKAVSWQNADVDSILIPIKFATRGVFDQYVLEAYTDDVGKPRYWTLIDYNVVHVNPYPNNAEQRAKIFFYVNRWYTIPSTDAGTFSIPEEFISMLVLNATAHFIKRHMDDPNISRSFEDEYIAELTQARARQMTIPGQAWNMYRGRRTSAYDTIW